MRNQHRDISGELVLVLDSHNGDQGKGKVVDYEAVTASIVVRPTGSDNAGHSISFAGTSIATHVHPSGVFTPGLTNLIGSGVSVFPPQLVKERHEIGSLVRRRPTLLVDRRTIITLPGHRIIDMLDEAMRGKGKIGSTKKGVAPSFGDFFERRAVRFSDFEKSDNPETLVALTKRHKALIETLYAKAYRELENKDDREMVARFLQDKDQLEVRSAMAELLSDVTLVDSHEVVMNALRNGEKVVVEGAQGFDLGIWTCDYPNGTSTDPGPAGIQQSLHLPPQVLAKARIIAVLKAYHSKVGSGPMAGEFYPEVFGDYQEHHGLAHRLHKRGNEVGTTSRRKRRLGPLYLPSLHRAINEWGFTEIALTHLDCFDGEDGIPVVEGYLPDGQPNLVSFKWGVSVSGMKTEGRLPDRALDFLTYLEESTGIPISTLSLGPSREDTISLVKHPLAV